MFSISYGFWVSIKLIQVDLNQYVSFFLHAQFIQILYRLYSDFLGYQRTEKIGNKFISYVFHLPLGLIFGVKRNFEYN